jgi:hypothetical protein
MFVEMLGLSDVEPGEDVEREIEVGLHDRIKVHFSSPEEGSVIDRVYLQCSVFTDENKSPAVVFAVGDRGLEHIGFGNLKFEEKGIDKSVRLRSSIMIGPQGNFPGHDDLQEISHRFGDLSYVLVKWLGDSIEEGGIKELPLKVSTATR